MWLLFVYCEVAFRAVLAMFPASAMMVPLVPAQVANILVPPREFGGSRSTAVEGPLDFDVVCVVKASDEPVEDLVFSLFFSLVLGNETRIGGQHRFFCLDPTYRFFLSIYTNINNEIQHKNDTY